jgi:hypothetical protein
MVDDRNPFSGFPTVVAREKIARNQLNIFSGIESTERVLKAVKLARGPNEAAEIGKTVIEKSFDDFCSDKTVGSCDQDAIVPGRNTFKIHRGSDLKGIKILQVVA